MPSWIAATDPIIPQVIDPSDSCLGGDVLACLRNKRGIEPKPRIPMRHVFSSRTAQPWNRKTSIVPGDPSDAIANARDTVPAVPRPQLTIVFGVRARDGSGTGPSCPNLCPVRVPLDHVLDTGRFEPSIVISDVHFRVYEKTIIFVSILVDPEYRQSDGRCYDFGAGTEAPETGQGA
ncbi:uncharacterized protein N7477_005504 [Penicillium maclennaniae]|uniref:uncharacterized protein n=1 Tax=Penicillium maclennaniae TaxID=1343394 RepID=UPI00254132D4|nr:uncharacterized protein N7477_005504 [Penicillium maclennaniae]KAJ5670141.1 hypothetical protein N7477_005504 [Penicillium maclennaniae]